MIIDFLTNASPTAGGAEWLVVDSWDLPADLPFRTPGKGELVKVDLGDRVAEMRVLEICQTGPVTVQVYLVPTYVKVT